MADKYYAKIKYFEYFGSEAPSPQTRLSQTKPEGTASTTEAYVLYINSVRFILFKG